MKKQPNSSILSIVTHCDNDTAIENILFIYLKNIPDYYSSDNIYWYEGKGKDGNALVLWNPLKIKQWVACGQDNVLSLLYDEIIEKQRIEIGTKSVAFSFPNYERIQFAEQPQKSRSEVKFDSEKIRHIEHIPQQFRQKENLAMLCGYKLSNDTIKPFFPQGFFETDFIYDHLRAGIIGVKEIRQPYFTFRGVQSSSIEGEGSTEMTGFYQKYISKGNECSAVFKNETNETIGKTTIIHNNGVFKVQLSEPSWKGNASIELNGILCNSIDYVLLQKITVNPNMASGTFEDAYGRSSLIASQKVRPDKFDGYTWQKAIFFTDLEAYSKLSDTIKYIIDYLGPKILISDPYYFNDIGEDTTTGQFNLEESTTALINAVTQSAVETGIEKLIILGYNSRANNHTDKNLILPSTKTEQRFNNYEKLLKNYVSSNRLQKYLKQSTIIFKNATEDFHNRYWFSIDDDGFLERCIIVTTSIGNMFEVDFISVVDENQLNQIRAKYNRLLNDSELMREI